VGPYPEDRLSGQVNDGIDAFQSRTIDLAGRRIPKNALCPGARADYPNHLITPAGKGADNARSDQAA
jgi:hypothetical protein